MRRLIWRILLTSLGVGSSVRAGAAGADEAPTILIIEIATEGVDAPDLGKTVTSLAAERIAAKGRKVATTLDLDERVEVEAQKDILGCKNDSACIARLTDPTLADLVVAGTIGRIGDSYILNLTLVDPEHSESKARAGTTFARKDDLPNALDRVLAELFAWSGQDERPAFRLPDGKESSFLVLDLSAAGVSDEIAKNLTQVLTKEIKGIEGAKVVNRDDVVAMLGYERMKNILTDCDTECLVEIGNALDTNYVVLGQIGKLSDTFLVSLTLIDQQAKLDVGNSYRVSEAFRGPEEQLIRAVGFSARRLLGVDATLPGGVQVSSQVQDASVFLGRRELGKVPLPPVHELEPGRYSLRLAKDGFYDWQSDIYVSPGETTAVWAELEEAPDPWYRKWWVWTVVGVVVAGGATAAVVASQSTPDNGTVTFVAEP